MQMLQMKTVSCTYADAGYDCDGVCLADADGDGVCDEFEVSGCQDAAACNYNADATDEGTVLVPMLDAGYDCDGVCLADADGDGVCDEFEVSGCQDASACNYAAGCYRTKTDLVPMLTLVTTVTAFA